MTSRQQQGGWHRYKTYSGQIFVYKTNFVILVKALFSLDVLGRRKNLKKMRKWRTKKMVTLMPKKLLREQLKIIPWQGV